MKSIKILAISLLIFNLSNRAFGQLCHLSKIREKVVNKEFVSLKEMKKCLSKNYTNAVKESLFGDYLISKGRLECFFFQSISNDTLVNYAIVYRDKLNVDVIRFKTELTENKMTKTVFAKLGAKIDDKYFYIFRLTFDPVNIDTLSNKFNLKMVNNLKTDSIRYSIY